MAKKTSFFYGWVIVAAGFVATGASVGIYNNCLSVFVRPVCEALGFSRGQFTLYNSIMAISQMLALPFYGEIFRKGNMKRVMLICTCLMTLVQFGFSFSTQLWHFYILAACHGASVQGISIVAISTIVNNWFNEKKGLATGVAVAGSGIVASVMVPIVTQVIEGFGWQWGYRLMAVAGAAVLFPVIILLIRIRPADMGLVPYGAAADYHEGDAVDQVGFTRSEAFKMPSFYLVVLALLTVCFGASSMQAHTMSYLQDIGHSSTFASAMVSLSMFTLTFGKIGVGWVMDRFGVMICGFTVCTTIFVAGLFMSYAVIAPLACVAAVSLGYGMACGSVAPSQVASRYFGTKDFARVYAAVSMVVSCSGIFGQPIPGFIYDITGSYRPAWILACTMTVLSAVLFILADRMNRVAWNKLIAREAAADAGAKQS